MICPEPRKGVKTHKKQFLLRVLNPELGTNGMCVTKQRAAQWSIIPCRQKDNEHCCLFGSGRHHSH